MTKTISNTCEEVRQRIIYLIKRLSANPDKRDKKEIREELAGYGIIPLRVKKKGVTLVTDIGTYLTEFIVDGKVETSMGTIIGYFCPDCLTAVTVRDAYTLFKLERQTQCMNCLICNSYGVMPLFGHYVLSPGDMGY